MKVEFNLKNVKIVKFIKINLIEVIFLNGDTTYLKKGNFKISSFVIFYFNLLQSIGRNYFIIWYN